jgi:hypothetical protein
MKIYENGGYETQNHGGGCPPAGFRLLGRTAFVVPGIWEGFPLCSTHCVVFSLSGGLLKALALQLRG